MYQCNMLDHAKTKLIIKDISTEDMNMIFIHMIIMLLKLFIEILEL